MFQYHYGYSIAVNENIFSEVNEIYPSQIDILIYKNINVTKIRDIGFKEIGNHRSLMKHDLCRIDFLIMRIIQKQIKIKF